ncbi:hypothetical protein ACPUEK_08385 [Marinomonas gallaica]|uniref:hypothetical protein n=1 Tax=Marinomonas gallaica TaxID=1806667 RepID=UPI003CE4B3BD
MQIIDDHKKFDRLDIINAVYTAIHPMKNTYDEDMALGLFIDCMAAIDSGIGIFFAFFNEEKNCVANAFVFRAEESPLGAPHLHIFSVPIKYQRSGYGKLCLNYLLPNLDKTGNVSSECSQDTLNFFINSGFSIKQNADHNNFIKIHYGNQPEKSCFLRPKLLPEGYLKYEKEFNDHLIFLKNKHEHEHEKNTDHKQH